MLFLVYTCQNATLLEISCTGSLIFVMALGAQTIGNTAVYGSAMKSVI